MTTAHRPGSLRERKKARTRAALIAVSQRMFAERGYTETTLEDICAEVEIRPQTLLRYFDSKAHLALAPSRDRLDALFTVLDDPRRERPTLDVWRDFLSQEADEVAQPTSGVTLSVLANMRAYRRWVDRDPALVAMESDLDRLLRERLGAALACDGGVPADDLHSTLVAALLVAGRSAVWERWLARADDDAAESLAGDLLSVVEYAVASLPRTNAQRLLSVAD